MDDSEDDHHVVDGSSSSSRKKTDRATAAAAAASSVPASTGKPEIPRRTRVPKRPPSAATMAVKSEPASKRQKKTTTDSHGNDDGVVSDADSFAKPDACTSHSKTAKVPTNDDDDGDDEGVMVVEPPAKPLAGLKHAGLEPDDEDDDDDGVQMMGVANEIRLPHLRQYCTETMPRFRKLLQFPFQCEARYIPPWASVGTEGNVNTCDLCYCYVCDKPAKECQRWSSDAHSTAFFNHCHAVDKGTHSKEWKEIRQLYKDKNVPRIHQLEQLGTQPFVMDPNAPLPAAIRVGAFAPTDGRAAPFFRSLTKCRKCQWYSYSGNHQRKDCKRIVEDLPAEWCLACGRIASKRTFTAAAKSKCQPYAPKPNDISIGTKTIPFRIKAHDPRKMKMFQTNWAQLEGTSPEWTYDEAEAEEDVVRHRFPTYPSLLMIMASISPLQEDKIPTDGTFPGWSLSRVKKGMAEASGDKSWHGDDNYKDNDDDRDQYKDCIPRARAEDTDALLVDRNGSTILQELYKFRSVGFPPHEKPCGAIAGDIMATWNRDERCGEFVVRIYYRQNDRSLRCLGPLLGVWFDVAPFPLSQLTCAMKACNTINSRGRGWRQAFPPFNSTNEELKAVEESMKGQIVEAVATYNNEIVAANISLKSSLGEASFLGGVSSADNSFTGVLQRYFRELVPSHLYAESYYSSLYCWAGRAAGVTSYHRGMAPTMQGGNSYFREVSIESYLRNEDIPLAGNNLSEDSIKVLQNSVSSMNGILVHLENLGHEEAPFVEGLNVELLPFQRQTLQWALERETIPGGLQSFLATKLPASSSTKDVYYRPVFESISHKKPKLVRGGMIADEMGLGKTVVSLALILQNPAPLLPASGSNSEVSTGDPANSAEAGWDDDWQRPEGQNPLRASIISRGTLVVCHVSLVSQWIDEARSKLDNPGLVYAYHGQSRKRDAMILAQNAIIVTTYATLAKDSTYHAGKAMKNGESGYCPPCEQIRWWRIICDESHSLKQDTVQTKAVMNLVGDHKWAVSGTPWSNSLIDIKNQLMFIGLEDVDQMFSQFQNAAFDNVNESSRRGCNANRKKYPDDRTLGHFIFLMRAALIRHSQSQQYRGTSTTLMSLPPKTERKILIDFSPLEAAEYARIEKEALDFYRSFKLSHGQELSRHYLLLMQKLMPLRIACSGGRIPLADEGEDVKNSDRSKDEPKPKKKGSKKTGKSEAPPKTVKKKKVIAFSDFRFQAKFNVLIDELKRTRDEEPDSKSLVFSQYSSSLKFLQEELPAHGFQFRTLSGDMTMKQRAESLHAFQNDPPTTIFLLSMRAGAVGINLTQANRVYLLEPAMNPSLEAQAVGRVHRLGQTRNVEIVRLLMKESIDTRISQLVDKKHSFVTPPCGATETADVGAAAPVATASAPIVGSMRTDKARIMGKEFDFLFGLQSSLDPVPFHAATAIMNGVDSDDNNSEFDDEGGHLEDEDFDFSYSGVCVPDNVKSENRN